LENLNSDDELNRALENIEEHIKPAAKCFHEFKQHKLWFNKEYLGF
jgi:uncharacterized protein YgfB (UPF0149 family)